MPSDSPTSCTITMFGWLSAVAARASRKRRSRRTGSFITSGGSTLIATFRPSERVLGEVDAAHAALADQFEHPVAAECGADHVRENTTANSRTDSLFRVDPSARW